MDWERCFEKGLELVGLLTWGFCAVSGIKWFNCFIDSQNLETSNSIEADSGSIRVRACISLLGTRSFVPCYMCICGINMKNSQYGLL